MAAFSAHLETKVENDQAQYVNSWTYNKRESYSSNHYHPGLRNHKNLSYGSNKNVLQLPPGFNNQNFEGKPSLEMLWELLFQRHGLSSTKMNYVSVILKLM